MNLFAILLLFALTSANAYRILGVFPTAATSHYKIGSALMKGLAAKGHNVTMVAAYTEKHTIDNYSSIHLKEVVTYMDGKY